MKITLKIILMRTLNALKKVCLLYCKEPDKRCFSVLLSYSVSKTFLASAMFSVEEKPKDLHCSFPYLFNKSSSVKSAAKWTTLKGTATNLVFQGKDCDVALSFGYNCSAKPGSLSRVRSTSNYSEQTCMCFEQLLLTNGAHNWRDR